MKKKIQKILLILVCAVIIAAFIIASYINTKTYYNKTNVIGNTACNLYNGGLYCEYGDYIYFHNFEDDGALYRMNASDCSNITRISTDYVCYINADAHYLYYSRYNNKKTQGAASIFKFYNNGIFRINRNGTENLKLLYENPSGLIQLFGNYIYYQHYNTTDGLKFYRVKIDAKEDSLLLDEAILPASFYHDTLYYAGVSKDHFIKTMSLNTFNENIVLMESCYFPYANEDGIYYMSLTDYTIHRVSHDGLEDETLVSEAISTYNITNDGKLLFYQVDRGKNNRICVLNLDTLKSTTILDGNYKEIHITSNYVFFKSFDDTQAYAYSLDGSGTLSNFKPTVESRK